MQQAKRPATGEDQMIYKTTLYLLGALVLLVCLLPALIGYGLFMLVRPFLRRLEYILITVASVVAVFLAKGAMGEYFSFLFRLATSRRFISTPVVVEILCLSGLALGLVGLLQGTAVAARIPSFFKPKTLGEKPSIIPTAREKQQLSEIVLPSPAQTGAMANTMMGDARPGERLVVLGMDRDGSPIGITEREIGTHALVFGSTGSGKALALDTVLPTPSGWTTMGDVEVGDEVFDENGAVCRVVFKTPVQYDRKCYEVVFSDGSKIIADADHRWFTDTVASRASESRSRTKEHTRRRLDRRDQRHKRAQPEVRTTQEIHDTLEVYGRRNHSVDVAGALQLPDVELPVDPYVLGAWLGDGRSRDGGLISNDSEVVDQVRAAGYEVRKWSHEFEYGITGLLPGLRQLGVLTEPARRQQVVKPRTPFAESGRKHIPAEYLRASYAQRLALLQGLMDTDGEATLSGNCVFAASNEELARDVYELVCSLGQKATIRVKRPRLNGVEHKLSYIVSFTGDIDAFRLTRKRARQRRACRVTQQRRFIVAVNPVDSVPVRCIQVDSPSHLYLAGESMIPTHNTETIKTLAGGLLDLGWQGILLDLKEDTKPGGLRDWCETYAHSHAIAYQELRLSDQKPQFWFDALAGLSQDEARDTILSLTRFDDEYYKNICIRVLGQLLKLRFWAHEVDPVNCPLPTLYDVAMTLSAPSLAASTKKWRAIVSQAMPDLSKSEFQVLESPSQVEQQQAASWGAKLGNLYETQAGRLVLRAPAPNEHRPRVDVTANGLIYIGLDSQGKPDLTKIVSSSVLQRISVEAAQRTTGTSVGQVKPKFLIVDEANWVDRTIVQNLLSRARSAGIAMVLCTQGPKDWIDKDGNDFAKLAQNTNVAMIMKQGEPEAAEICADYIGTVDFQKFTQRIEDGSFSGGGSLMDRTEHIVSPNDLRGLGTGEMVMRVSTPHVRTQWLRVMMRDPRTHAGGQLQTPQGPQSGQQPPSSRGRMRPPPPGPGTPGLARPPIQ